MCDSKPGTRCTAHAGEALEASVSQYNASFPDGPPPSALDPAVTAGEARPDAPQTYMGLDLATAAPADVDAQLVTIEVAIAKARDRLQYPLSAIAHIEKSSAESRTPYERRSLESARESVERITAEIAEQEALAAPLQAEFARRGGWPRYFLVTNGNGHVHSSTACATCRPSTNFAFLHEQSGMSEGDLVELAGEAACSVCFPEAPVSTSPSRLEAPEAKNRRIEREQQAAQKSAAAAAKALVSADGQPVTDEDGRPLATERAATNARTAALKNLAFYGTAHPDAAAWERVAREVTAAVAAKHGRTVEDVHAEAVKKAAAAYRREFGRPWPTPSWTPKTPRD